MYLCQVLRGYPWVCPMGLMLSDKECDYKATSNRCFRRHLVVMHATCWSMFRRGSEARESFAPLSFQDNDCQHISITNCQGGRSQRCKRLLREAGVPVDTPAAEATSRKVNTSVMLLSPTVRRLSGHSPSGVITASPSSMFVVTSPSSTTDPTPVSSDVAQSQPEQTEFAVPVAAPPLPVLHSRDIFLPTPALSPYRLVDYVSKTPESVSSLSEGGLSEEDRLLSDELAEIDENRSAYELMHEPRKRVSFRVKALNSRYLEEVVARTKPENWLEELLEPQASHMRLRLSHPRSGTLLWSDSTLESPGVRPWDRPLSSAPTSLSRASSPPDLSPPHLPIECSEADAAAVATSL